MKKRIVIGIATVALLLTSNFTKAHSSAISTTKLTQKANNSWHISVKAAITAYEYEVRQHFGAGSFKNQEEFKQILVQYALETLVLKTKEGKSILLKDGQVKLAHESTVSFELERLPYSTDSLILSNQIFKHIHGHQGSLEVMTYDSIRQRYILNKNNNFTQQFHFISEPKEEEVHNELSQNIRSKNRLIMNIAFALAGLLIFGGVIFYSLKKKKRS